mmetsp:Transcript_47403/g.135938  ORF Transcript_47403/g.135938 Transcript_47403/m.135938 type:complete len:185 (+) Transcript_47403:124-678(+)
MCEEGSRDKEWESKIKGAQTQAAERRVSERWAVPVTDPRPVPVSQGSGGASSAATGGPFTPSDFLGTWADSLGNAVIVSSEDAFELRLLAVLSQPPRRDIHLAMRPIPGGGWSCGNAMLDPTWSSPTQLHWLTADGRISVWVRLLPDGADSGSWAPIGETAGKAAGKGGCEKGYGGKGKEKGKV